MAKSLFASPSKFAAFDARGRLGGGAGGAGGGGGALPSIQCTVISHDGGDFATNVPFRKEKYCPATSFPTKGPVNPNVGLGIFTNPVHALGLQYSRLIAVTLSPEASEKLLKKSI